MMRRAFAAVLLGSLLTPAQSAAQAPGAAGDAELRARHALPQSHFAEIAGETNHYTDEGQGPVLVLVHGSFASLRQWDPWMEVLLREFRVVRFDLSPQGLSGPQPGNDYSVEQRMATIDGLADLLGLGSFTIVGASSSGTAVAAYAAVRPERVNAVVLSNIAVGQLKMDFSNLPPALTRALAEDREHPEYHLPEYWRQIMLLNVSHPQAVTDEVVTRWTELNNRPLAVPGIAQAVAAGASALRTPGDLAAITVPTLLLWSQDDHETRLEREGLNVLAALKVADRTLVVVGGCGHMLLLDCPAASLDATLPFLRRVNGIDRE